MPPTRYHDASGFLADLHGAPRLARNGDRQRYSPRWWGRGAHVSGEWSRPDSRQDSVIPSLGRWIFDPIPRLMRSMQPVGSAPTGFFTWPRSWAKRALPSAAWYIDFCHLFLSLGPSIPRGNLPFAALRSVRRTVLLLRIVKEHVDLTVLFSTYLVNTFQYTFRFVPFARQSAIEDTMRHIDSRGCVGAARLRPVGTRPVVNECGWWGSSPDWNCSQRPVGAIYAILFF